MRLWQQYKEALLSEQFKMEWIAYCVLAVIYLLIITVLSFVGVL